MVTFTVMVSTAVGQGAARGLSLTAALTVVRVEHPAANAGRVRFEQHPLHAAAHATTTVARRGCGWALALACGGGEVEVEPDGHCEAAKTSPDHRDLVHPIATPSGGHALIGSPRLCHSA